MENIDVSVIIPVYKVPEKMLRTCIESVIKQTHKNIEIILIDDGSPDNCGVICDEYAQKDDRVNVIHKVNEGLSEARNTGVRNSNGKWIMFVDGDDWIESDMCQVMFENAEKDSVQLVICGISKDYGSAKEEYKFYLEDNKVYSNDECRWLQEQLLVYNGNIAVAYSKLILKEFIFEYDVFHNKNLKQGAEGLEFNLRLFENINKVKFINKPFYHYVYNDMSISASHNEKNHELVVKCFDKINEFVKLSANSEKLSHWFDNRLLYVIITTAISGYFNPTNLESYKEKKRKYKEYLSKPIIKKAMKTKNKKGLSKQRLIVLWMIKNKQFWMLDIMGKIRKMQKKFK